MLTNILREIVNKKFLEIFDITSIHSSMKDTCIVIMIVEGGERERESISSE